MKVIYKNNGGKEHKSGGHKTNRLFILFLAVAIVSIAFVLGWQFSKIYSSNTSDSAVDDFNWSSSTDDTDTLTGDTFQLSADDNTYNSKPSNTTDSYVGEYQITTSDSMDYCRLFINEDYTARIIKKKYDVIFYYKKNGKIKKLNTSHAPDFIHLHYV